MIRREEPEATWLIHQGAHAAIAGQIAVHWIGGGQMVLDPREELLLAAHNHDAGWVAADQSPHLTPNGQPRNFTEMDLDQHFSIWRASVASVFMQNRYAGLLTSLHSTALYDLRLRFLDDPEAERARIRAYVDEAKAWQSALIAALHDHPRYGAAVTGGALGTNLRLLQVWDYLSLMLCMSTVHEQVLDDVPLGENGARGEIRLLPGGPRVMLLDPYPLDAPLTLWADAHPLPAGSTFADEDALRAALERAGYAPRTFEIAPLHG